MSWMTKLERKFGKYAISNLTLYLIICYAIGYVLQIANGQIIAYLTLNPYAILHGQIWRLVTWVLIPPESLDFFTLIMLYFYFSIGSSLERCWGTFAYNVYLFSGMLFTVIGAFVFYFCTRIMGMHASDYAPVLGQLYSTASFSFSTYYICMSIMLAFAATFPNVQVLIMFILPIKIKVLGIIYALILGYDLLTTAMFLVRAYYDTAVIFFALAKVMAIVFSLLNFVIFFVTTRKSFRTPGQIKRQKEYKQKIVKAQKIAKHKCAICGRTQEEYPDLAFRFCSKCEGNYEYCSEHLFTHTHVKR